MAENILKLKVDSSEYDAKIKRASQGLQQLDAALKKSGGSFADCDQQQVKFIRELGKMPTVAQDVKGKIRELSNAYTDLKVRYNEMSEAEKRGAGGQALAKSLDQMKGRVLDMKKQLADVDKELNATGSSASSLSPVIGELGSKFGISSDLLSGLTTGTLAYTAAIGAAATAVAAAVKAWAEYNTELGKQDNATMVVTGLQGGDASAMTSMGRAIAKTYGVDFRNTIEAANTLMSQFGVTSEEAMKLLRDGMQGMINGDGQKLLSMIHQYAPAFRDAGVSASQLVAVIQNSEGGIFTDENMAAIVMGIKNIRLMTKQTSDALKQMGIDGEKMSQQLNDGSLTVFDALRQVTEKLKDVNSNSQTAGEVMQAVFGRQGTMAGANLAKAIDTLNTNLEETKTQTGEVGQAFAELERANERLEKAMRNAFGNEDWLTMSTGIKTELTDALTGVLRIVNLIEEKFKDLGITGETAFAKIMNGISQASLAIQSSGLWSTVALIKGLSSYGRRTSTQTETSGQSVPAGMTKGGAGQLLQQIGNFSFANSQNSPLATKYQSTQPNPNPKPNPNPDNNDKDKVPLVEGGIKGLKEFSGILNQTTESLSDLRKQLAEYQAARDNASNTADYAAAQQGIADTQRRIGAQEAAIRMGVDTDSILAIEDKMKEELENMKDNLPKLEIQAEVNTGKVKSLAGIGENIADEWQNAAKAVGLLGGALQQVEDPSAKIAGLIGQAIASIALTFATSLKGTITPWDWIAAAIAGTATMITTIASIKSATAGSYEQGGIVPGTSYHGDHLTASVNSGELILNRVQQDRLAADMQNGGIAQRIELEAVVSAEKLLLVQNNRGLRTGKGEIVQSNRVR